MQLASKDAVFLLDTQTLKSYSGLNQKLQEVLSKSKLVGFSLQQDLIQISRKLEGFADLSQLAKQVLDLQKFAEKKETASGESDMSLKDLVEQQLGRSMCKYA